jgi:hypothetical protein
MCRRVLLSRFRFLRGRPPNCASRVGVASAELLQESLSRSVGRIGVVGAARRTRWQPMSRLEAVKPGP